MNNPEPRSLTLTDWSPKTLQMSYTAGPAETAVITAFCEHIYDYSLDPGKARDQRTAHAISIDLRGQTAWDNFPDWCERYRKSRAADPRPELNAEAFSEWCRQILRDYAHFLAGSGGGEPTETHPAAS